jgi:5'-nucleotidase
VNGTPADCVKIAVSQLLEAPPDLVISGVNWGLNTGLDVLYSGTVAAAMEGAMNDLPSLALSLERRRGSTDFSAAIAFARRFVRQIPTLGFPRGVMLNVNFPALPPSEISGIVVTQQSLARSVHSYERRQSPFGKEYFWIADSDSEEQESTETDESVVRSGKIAVTPLSADRTAYRWLEKLRSVDWSASEEG